VVATAPWPILVNGPAALGTRPMEDPRTKQRRRHGASEPGGEDAVFLGLLRVLHEVRSMWLRAQPAMATRK